MTNKRVSIQALEKAVKAEVERNKNGDFPIVRVTNGYQGCVDKIKSNLSYGTTLAAGGINCSLGSSCTLL